MTVAVHVFMGSIYYPEAGVGDYVRSFYGENAIDRAEEWSSANFNNDWCVILVDEGNGLREHSYRYSR
jgi:hypothetical protein